MRNMSISDEYHTRYDRLDDENEEPDLMEVLDKLGQIARYKYQPLSAALISVLIRLPTNIRQGCSK